MFVFRKIWCALFSGNTRFGIRPFTLLPTKLEMQFKCYFKGFRMHSTLWFIRKTVYGVGKSLLLMYSYLKNCRQYVRRNNTQSDFMNV